MQCYGSLRGLSVLFSGAVRVENVVPNVHVSEFFILEAIQGTLNQRNRSNSDLVIAILGYWIVFEHV